MTTPHAQNTSTGADQPAPVSRISPDGAEQPGAGENAPAPRDVARWLHLAFYSIGAVACVGFVIVLAGAYVVSDTSRASDALIIAGTSIITIAAIAWIAVTVCMIAAMSKGLLKGGRKTV